MVYGSIRFSDFRCFSREHPATLPIQPGFTALIGPNNAGKSTLIRSLYELRDPISRLCQCIRDSNLNAHLSGTHGFNILPPMSDAAEMCNDRASPQCRIEFIVDSMDHTLEPYVRSAWIELNFNPLNSQTFKFGLKASDGNALVANSGGAYVVNGASTDFVTVASGLRFQSMQILDFLAGLLGSMFVGPFRNAINEGAANHYDLAVGTGFIANWHSWKTGGNKTENRAIQRVTEDIRRLIGANTLEINASNELKTLQVVIDNRPHKLLELGAGISQLIITLGNALIRKPTFIVIDEPETHLHPGLQAQFLTSLASYAERGVLFSTHSLGLAKSIGDQRLAVRSSPAGSKVTEYERTSRLSEFLGSMGLASLQEFGWDRILLVEGTTDVRTFQQWLRIYGLDRHTVVLPLGGGSLVNGRSEEQIAEIRRLGSKIFAVVDSERADEISDPIKDRREFGAVCERLDIPCCITALRATENYLTQRAIDEVFPSRYTALAPFAKGVPWGKSENWRIAQQMTRQELDATDIGKFLSKMCEVMSIGEVSGA